MTHSVHYDETGLDDERSFINLKLGEEMLKIKVPGGNSQNFLCKFVRFFLNLKCFYRVVIHRK